MLRYKSINLSPTGTGETTANALAGIGERKRIIRELWVQLVTKTTGAGSLTLGHKIRAYKRQDQVLDASLTSFREGRYSTTYWNEDMSIYKLDLPLDQGDGFQVGIFNSAATPPDAIMTIVYEDQ